jgi:dTDP-glucose 4,6-dehydratase
MSNILVAGAAGFIASNFIHIKSKMNEHNIIGLDSMTYAADIHNLDGVNKDKFEFIKGDISNQDLISEILVKYDIEQVINFAAESHVDNSITGSKIFIDTNILGVHSLLQSALNYYQKLDIVKKEKFKFLQISTDEVFGSLELDSKDKFNELTRYQPSSPYSASKAAGDHLVRAWYETYGLPTIITNCTNNYGARQHREKLIPKTIYNAINNLPITIYGNGQNIRDWIYVDDHVTGIDLALNYGKNGYSYCFGGDAEKNNIEVVTNICDILDKLKPKSQGSYSDQITFIEDRLGHDLRYAVDNKFSHQELGFKPENSFNIAIEKTIKWYLDKWI